MDLRSPLWSASVNSAIPIPSRMPPPASAGAWEYNHSAAIFPQLMAELAGRTDGLSIGSFGDQIPSQAQQATNAVPTQGNRIRG
jgi:hypothetical protein